MEHSVKTKIMAYIVVLAAVASFLYALSMIFAIVSFRKIAAENNSRFDALLAKNYCTQNLQMSFERIKRLSARLYAQNAPDEYLENAIYDGFGLNRFSDLLNDCGAFAQDAQEEEMLYDVRDSFNLYKAYLEAAVFDAKNGVTPLESQELILLAGSITDAIEKLRELDQMRAAEYLFSARRESDRAVMLASAIASAALAITVLTSACVLFAVEKKLHEARPR